MPSRSCWSSWRNSRLICPSCASSISIPFWPTRMASLRSMPASRWLPSRRRRGPSGHPRFAIRPYPKEWERRTELRDGTKILVRPVRPEDEPLYGPFFAAVTQQDLRLRFFAPVKEFGHTFIARFTQIDYARAMAFIAIEESSGNMLGVVRLHADANYERGEYAILVRSDLKGRGL